MKHLGSCQFFGGNYFGRTASPNLTCQPDSPDRSDQEVTRLIFVRWVKIVLITNRMIVVVIIMINMVIMAVMTPMMMMMATCFIIDWCAEFVIFWSNYPAMHCNGRVFGTAQRYYKNITKLGYTVQCHSLLYNAMHCNDSLFPIVKN